MRATQWTAPVGSRHEIDSGDDRRASPLAATTPNNATAPASAPLRRFLLFAWAAIHIRISASTSPQVRTFAQIDTARGNRARRHGSARQAGAEDIISDRLDKQVVETAVIGPFGASGVDIEQQFGLSAGQGGEQDAFAQCGVVAVDRAREVDAPLVVGPSPVRTPCMT